MPRLCLLDENGHLTGQWEIGDDPVSVGRDDSADVVVDDSSLSNQHFVIRRKGRHYFLEDLGTMSGTWVGGHAAGTAPLKHHICIVAGKSVFLFAEVESTQCDDAREAHV